MYYSGLEFHSKSSPEGNPDSSPPFQSPVYVCTHHRTPVGNWYLRPTYIYPMIAISEKTPETPGLSITFGTLSACRSFETKDYWTFSHCFYRISFCSRVYMYVLGMRLTVTAKANHSRQKHFAHGKSKFSHGKSKFAHGKSNSLTAKANRSRHKTNQLRMLHQFIVEVCLFS